MHAEIVCSFLPDEIIETVAMPTPGIQGILGRDNAYRVHHVSSNTLNRKDTIFPEVFFCMVVSLQG